jgi:ribosome-binding factor A
MPADNRATRVAAQLRQELARLIGRDLADPRLAALVVTSVTLTKDLRVAKVFWRLASVAAGAELAAERDDAALALERSQGRLRRAVTARLGLRFAPELRFAYDGGQEARDRIDELLHEVSTERAAGERSREPSGKDR